MPLFARTAQLVTPLFLVVTMAPASANAQAVRFADLSTRLKPGDTVSIIGDDGQSTAGRIAGLTTDSLTLQVSNAGSRTFPEASVRRILVRDSLKNGVINGLVVGAVSGAVFGLFASYNGCDDYGCLGQVTAMMGGIFAGGGAATGAGIDRLLKRSIDVSPRRAGFTVSPVLSPDRQALVASVRF